MTLNYRHVEIPGYFRYVLIAGLVGALLLIHFADRRA
jgi:uncharacterized membrane protein